MAPRPNEAPLTVAGVARVDRRTKSLVKRLRPGEIAVIDHEDLDRVAAEGLVEAGPAAVINAARSISGRYPNVGPLLLAAAGIPLVDDTGHDVMTAVSDGSLVRVDGARVMIGERCVGQGCAPGPALVGGCVRAGPPQHG